MQPPFLVLTFFYLFPFILRIPTSCESTDNANFVRFDLFHRHHRDLSERITVPQTDHERMRESAYNDQRRHRWVSMKLGRNHRRRANEVGDPDDSFRIPMSSGSYAHSGSYFVIFYIGTPSQKFLMVADTGSDLAWINCRYGCQNCKRDRSAVNRRIFRADDSKSFLPIPCSSNLCKYVLPDSVPTICPAPTKPCYYQYGYLGGDRSMGFYANESATVYLSGGGKRKIKGFLVGCSTSFAASSYNVIDGILGLGHCRGFSFSDVSLKYFGGKFSYCLVDRNSSRFVKNYLIFGPAPQPHPTQHLSMTYATLIANELNEPHYGVQVKGISVGGVMLDIPPMVWDLKSRGGAIIDSGSTLTFLPEPALVPVLEAFRGSLKGFKEVPDPMFNFCFSVDDGFSEDVVPKLAWHLGESAEFQPPVKNYILSDLEDKNTRCIGIAGITWPGVTIIGNLMQQEHFWEFDTKNGLLGFRPSSCILDCTAGRC